MSDLIKAFLCNNYTHSCQGNIIIPVTDNHKNIRILSAATDFKFGIGFSDILGHQQFYIFDCCLLDHG